MAIADKDAAGRNLAVGMLGLLLDSGLFFAASFGHMVLADIGQMPP
jgi:hypothetical protein